MATLFCPGKNAATSSAIKYVKQALITKGGKREYCQEIGMEYLVLKRTPAPGLPKRSSTNLRGF